MRSYQIIGCTMKGPVREQNEDHILVGRFIKNRGRLALSLDHDDDFLADYGLLFAVADGIGGAAGGAAAGKMALTAMERQFYGVEKTGKEMDAFAEALMSAAVRANNTILGAAANRPDLKGMGSTISGVCLTPHGYLVFNAGDSRVYRFRNGVLKPLTRDDSVTAVAVEAGQMTLAEAESCQSRHVLTNCLGSASFQLAVTPGPELRDNDILLICSDGLHDLISHDDMEKRLSDSRDTAEVIKNLSDEAVSNGGYDNISIILIRSDLFEYESGPKEDADGAPEETV